MTRGSYFKAFYHRLAARKGKKRAIVAVAHALFTPAICCCGPGENSTDLGEDYFDRLDRDRLTKRLSSGWKSWDIRFPFNPQRSVHPDSPGTHHISDFQERNVRPEGSVF